MKIRLLEAAIVTEKDNTRWTIRCSPFAVDGRRGHSRSRRQVSQYSVVGHSIANHPHMVMSIIEIEESGRKHPPVLISGVLEEVDQDFCYMPFKAYQFAIPGGKIQWALVTLAAINEPFAMNPVLHQPENANKMFYCFDSGE